MGQGRTMKETFDVTGMSCAACAARVEKTSNAVDGGGERKRQFAQK
jgi:copper chaperone CopZ